MLGIRRRLCFGQNEIAVSRAVLGDKMEKIYIIKKLWVDTLENRNAYGFEIIGFVFDKAEAERISNLNEIPKSNYPWPLNYAHEFEGDNVPEFIYEEVQEITERKIIRWKR